LPTGFQQDLLENADRSLELYFSPTAAKGFEKNWIPTVARQGWFTYRRLYVPAELDLETSTSNLPITRLCRNYGIASSLPVIRPEPRNLGSLVSALLDERLGDSPPIDTQFLGPSRQANRNGKGGISETRSNRYPEADSSVHLRTVNFGFWTDEWQRANSFVRYPSIIDKVDECGRLVGELQSPNVPSKACPERARRAASQKPLGDHPPCKTSALRSVNCARTTALL
jgi:hypothetical protein